MKNKVNSISASNLLQGNNFISKLNKKDNIIALVEKLPKPVIDPDVDLKNLYYENKASDTALMILNKGNI